jgi:hypothetical protein
MGDVNHRENLEDVVSGKLQLELISWSEEKAEGAEPVVLVETLYRPNSVRNKSWYLPAAGYTCSRYQMFNGDSRRPGMEAKVEVFDTVNGFKYAKRGKRTTYRDGEVEGTDSFEVSSVRLRASEIPDTLFEPTIPKGDTLFDEDLKVFIRDPEVAQAHLDEAVKLVSKNESSSNPGWLLPGGLVVAVTLVGTFLAWRRSDRF